MATSLLRIWQLPATVVEMQQYTIHDLFPGVEGRMEFVRVMLYLRMPQLRDYDRAQPLSPNLVDKLLEARKAVRNG